MSMNEMKPKRAKRQFDEAFRRNAVALVEFENDPGRCYAASSTPFYVNALARAPRFCFTPLR